MAILLLTRKVCTIWYLKMEACRQKKRVGLDLIAVKEGLKRESDHIRWVPTRHMLADPLTKYMTEAAYLEHVLHRGTLSLVESDEARQVFAEHKACIKTMKKGGAESAH